MADITLNEVSYSVMEAYRANVKDTDDIDIRWIKFLVNNARAKLLKQKFDKPFGFTDVDNSYIQKYTPSGQAVAMELVDSSSYTTILSGRYMKRTSVAIPKTIERRGTNNSFTRIGPADRLSMKFDIITYEHALVYGNGKFNKHSVAAFLLGDRIHLISADSQIMNAISRIDIWGVFQNPVEVSKDNDSTYTDDDEYPINKSLAQDIETMILDKEFRYTFKPPIDTDPINTELVNKEI